MGKTTTKSRFSSSGATPHSSKTMVATNLQKVSKSAPRQLVKRQSTMQYIRETAAALVSSQTHHKPRLDLPAKKATPGGSRKTFYTPSSESKSNTTVTRVAYPSRSHRESGDGRRRSEKGNSDDMENTFVVEEHKKELQKERKSKSENDRLLRSETFVIRSALKQGSSSGLKVHPSQKEKEQTSTGRSSQPQPLVNTRRSESSTKIDSVIDTIIGELKLEVHSMIHQLVDSVLVKYRERIKQVFLESLKKEHRR